MPYQDGRLMERIPVSLLTISVDPDLVKPPTQSPGDAYDRQLKYAGILEQYHAITFVKRAVDLKPLQPAPNFAVYPVGSRSLLWFVRDAVRLGDQLCRAQRIDAISTQDPFFTALIGYRPKRKCGLPLSLQSAADQVDTPYRLAERGVSPAS